MVGPATWTASVTKRSAVTVLDACWRRSFYCACNALTLPLTLCVSIKQKCFQSIPIRYISWLQIALQAILDVGTRDVKFVFFPNSNFVCKIRILFELRLCLWYLVFSRIFGSTSHNRALLDRNGSTCDLWLVTCVDLGLGLVANCKKATSISLYFFISQESQV